MAGQSINIVQYANAPTEFWCWLTDDAGMTVDPTGLVASMGFRYQTAWTEFQGEVVDSPEHGVPAIHLTIPDSFRANLVNREINVRLTVGGVTYNIWSYRVPS